MKKEPICVTPETEQRHLERRASDVSYKRKAAKFDQIVADSQYWFATFSQHHDIAFRAGKIADAVRFASLSHEHFQILKLAGITVTCRCSYCEFSNELINRSPERARLIELCRKVAEAAE